MGQTVRVSPLSCSSNSYPRRADISCVNEDKTVDVIYLCRTIMGEIEEESNVEESRCSQLLDWEVGNEDNDTLRLKDWGNKLFVLKDYEAAVDWYHKALDSLDFPSPSVGCSVVVAPSRQIDKKVSSDSPSSSYSSNGDTKLTPTEIRQRSFRMGTISDCHNCDKGTLCDVMFDDSCSDEYDGGDDEEIDVDISRLTIIHQDPSKRAIEASLYSNLAKSSFFLRRFGWTVRYSSIAILIQTLDWTENGDEKRKKNICDLYFVRVRAFLSSARPLLAAKDIKALSQLDETRAKTLNRELEQFKAKRQASNKKLARDVAAWVDQAMQINAQKTVQRKSDQQGISNINNEGNDESFGNNYDEDNGIDSSNDYNVNKSDRNNSDPAKRSWGQWLSGMIS